MTGGRPLLSWEARTEQAGRRSRPNRPARVARAAFLGLAAAVSLAGAPARASITAGFTGLGTFFAPSVHHAGVTVTGSADVYVLEFNGLGIVGGVDSTVVDFGETISFDFDKPAAEDIQVGFSFLNALVAVDVEAFAPGGASLGVVTLGPTPPQNFDLSALFGDAPIEAFDLTAIGSTLRVGSITYAPEPTTAALLAGGLLGLAARRRATRGRERTRGLTAHPPPRLNLPAPAP